MSFHFFSLSTYQRLLFINWRQPSLLFHESSFIFVFLIFCIMYFLQVIRGAPHFDFPGRTIQKLSSGILLKWPYHCRASVSNLSTMISSWCIHFLISSILTLSSLDSQQFLPFSLHKSSITGILSVTSFHTHITRNYQ